MANDGPEKTAGGAGRHSIDTRGLQSWLERHLPGFRPPLEVEKFPEGQSNPTYRLATGGGNYVLRRKPPGQLLANAHALDPEFPLPNALAEAQGPRAHVFPLCAEQ